MKQILLILFLCLTFSACQTVQMQSNNIENNIHTNTNSNAQSNNKHYGYARFTKSDKTYLGCWRSTKAREVVNFKLRYFYFTEKTIQTSKMSKTIAYKEEESNNYKDYFVLKTESKNNNLQPYLRLNIVSNDEMTIGELNVKDSDDYEEYWNLKREDCKKVLKNFN